LQAGHHSLKGAGEDFTMPFVKCSVGGCSIKLQPILKVDPKDRDTWFYRECDNCFRPACEKHSSEIDGKIICDRCRKDLDKNQEAPALINLGIRPTSQAKDDKD
jgi:hypothetical protein